MRHANAVLFSLALALPAAAQDRARIDAILTEQQQAEHIPGFAFVAVKDDGVVLLTTRGFRDLERKLPVTAETLFPIGSCTKSFTAMALAVSQERGLVSLDESPRRLLPYFKMQDPEADALVTLRDMLSHQTGLKAYADLAAEPGVLTREQYLRAALPARPVAKARTRFQYSNAMYVAAGEVLARAQGTPWETAIERTLFVPIGMSHSVASLHAMDATADHVTGYDYRPASRDWEPVRPPASLDVLGPAGAIASTANDLARWLRFLLGGGAIDGRRVLSEATLRDVTRPHVKARDSFDYALGWAVYRWNGHTVVEHNGGSRGISALVSFMPERRTGFAFLANISPNAMTRIGNAGRLMWPILIGEAETPASPTPSPSPSPPAPPAVGLPAVDALLARMIEAQGGARRLARHRSMEVRASKSYENQGVQADVTILAAAPDRRSEEETWTAAGVPIGSARVFFDGTRGGQETTFGQDETYDGDAVEKARRDSALHPLLAVRALYRDVKLERRGSVEGESTYVLDLVPAQGPAVALHVSPRTMLVVQRVTPDETVTFGDYRKVDGERVPFRTTIQDALGEATVTARSVRFNVPAPASAFSARKPAR